MKIEYAEVQCCTFITGHEQTQLNESAIFISLLYSLLPEDFIIQMLFHIRLILKINLGYFCLFLDENIFSSPYYSEIVLSRDHNI